MHQKNRKLEKIIHISTSEVYGSAQQIPISEKQSLVVGQSPYSASKISAEQLCIAYNKSFSLPVTILRPFNVFGLGNPQGNYTNNNWSIYAESRGFKFRFNDTH